MNRMIIVLALILSGHAAAITLTDLDLRSGLDHEEQQAVQESLSNNKVKLRDILKSVRHYRRFKRSNRQLVKSFKREARQQLREWGKEDPSYWSSENQLAATKEFEAKMASKGIRLGMLVHCPSHVAVELPLLGVESSSRCLKHSQGKKIPVEMLFGGLGAGLGVAVGIDSYFVCLVDAHPERKSNFNLGVRANLEIGKGINGGLAVGMNGVCMNYGFAQLGFGVGLYASLLIFAPH